VAGDSQEGGGARLGQAVALHRWGAHDDLEELLHVDGQGSAARDEHADAAAESHLGLAKDNLVEEAKLVLVLAALERAEAAGVRLVKEPLLEAARLGDSVRDLAVHAVVDAGHSGENRGLQVRDVLHELEDVALHAENEMR
jgi:hypothetical protein